MMDITVKTLDSLNHLFTVPETMLVKDFKTEITEKVGIPVDQQRLIFRGRVLQDEKKISEYDVGNNKIRSTLCKDTNTIFLRWVGRVQEDMNRQKETLDQPPFSPVYVALLSRNLRSNGKESFKDRILPLEELAVEYL